MTAKPLALVADSIPSPTCDLIDALIEAVVLPPDPPARAAAISSLVYEMCLAIEWLHATETAQDRAGELEVLSVRRLAAAVEDHQARMNALVVDPFGPS